MRAIETGPWDEPAPPGKFRCPYCWSVDIYLSDGMVITDDGPEGVTRLLCANCAATSPRSDRLVTWDEQWLDPHPLPKTRSPSAPARKRIPKKRKTK